MGGAESIGSGSIVFQSVCFKNGLAVIASPLADGSDL